MLAPRAWQLPVLILSLAACGPGYDGRGQEHEAPPPDDNDDSNARGETCGNGLDDNKNGVIDEECSCNEGTTQACWTAPSQTRGVGACRDGVQTCTGAGEFSSWGSCEGAVRPMPDTTMDGVDQDCSGEDGPDTICRNLPESCDSGDDEDCDGLVDCADADCEAVPPCAAATCTGQCQPGFTRWCDTPIDCSWGRQTCNPDGRWGACNETTPPPECYDGWDDEYDTGCCLALANACCQNYPHDNSVGECAGNSPCP